jgi:hypothetical protein
LLAVGVGARGLGRAPYRAAGAGSNDRASAIQWMMVMTIAVAVTQL